MFQNLKTKINKRFYGEVNYYKKQGMKIGKNCTLIGKVKFGSEPYLITLGDNVRITDGVRFITHDGGVHVLRNAYDLFDIDKFGRITIGNNVFVGMEVTILPNVNIGNNVVIGAGSIVTKDIPDNSVACGVPAKVISTIEEYYNKNRKFFIETKKLNYEEKKDFVISWLKSRDKI